MTYWRFNIIVFTLTMFGYLAYIQEYQAMLGLFCLLGSIWAERTL